MKFFSPSFFATNQYYPGVHTFAGDFFPFGAQGGYCSHPHFDKEPGLRVYAQQASTEPDFLVATEFEMERLASYMRCGVNVGACQAKTLDQLAVQEFYDKLGTERTSKQKYISPNVGGARILHRMWNTQNPTAIRGIIQQRSAKTPELKYLFKAAYAREAKKVIPAMGAHEDQYTYMTDATYVRSTTLQLAAAVTDNEIDAWLTQENHIKLKDILGDKWDGLLYNELIDFSVPTWQDKDILFAGSGKVSFADDDAPKIFLDVFNNFLTHCPDIQFTFSLDYQTWFPIGSYTDRRDFLRYSKNELRTAWNQLLWKAVQSLPGFGKGTKIRKFIDMSSERPLTLQESQQLQQLARTKLGKVKKAKAKFFLEIRNITKGKEENTLEPM